MKISRLKIRNFRGIKEADLLLPDHAVLIGDNNVGKSTILEALNLVLGPDRLSSRPVVNEHDFFCGEYCAVEGEDSPKIFIEATITKLNKEQRSRFIHYIEWWDQERNALHTEPPPCSVDHERISPALRVSFTGFFDEDEDDFIGQTYFAKSDDEEDKKFFRKKDKQFCGFLYLRSLRTGSRALSLEHGSLLDIILRLKEIRPQMWEKTISALVDHDVASDPELGISGILDSVEKSIKKYVPKEWGIAPRLKVSNLTREHLRKVITAFIPTGEGDHTAPFFRQGTGTINLLVLALLSQIAEDKQSVVFAMEEPETAIPPYTQKQVVHNLRRLSAQSLFTSHSPYVLEEFSLDETLVLSRQADGLLIQNPIQLPDSVKHKRYQQEFRTRFCEALLSRRVLVAEGAAETSAMPAVARRLSELNSGAYSSLEALGITTLDAGGETRIADLAGLYGSLDKQVFAICDQQEASSETRIKTKVDELFMHPEKGFENLVLKNTTQAAMERFVNEIEWPQHLAEKYPNPKAKVTEALCDYFAWSKGDRGIADFLSSCQKEGEVPEWIRNTCSRLREICDPPNVDDEESN